MFDICIGMWGCCVASPQKNKVGGLICGLYMEYLTEEIKLQCLIDTCYIIKNQRIKQHINVNRITIN